jgi:hypothetical protein
MKKVLTMLLVAGIFGLVACGPSADETTATEAVEAVEEVAEEAVEAAEEATEEVAEHTCSDDCLPDDDDHVHGGQYHSCADGCAGMDDAEADVDATKEG